MNQHKTPLTEAELEEVKSAMEFSLCLPIYTNNTNDIQYLYDKCIDYFAKESE